MPSSVLAHLSPALPAHPGVLPEPGAPLPPLPLGKRWRAVTLRTGIQTDSNSSCSLSVPQARGCSALGRGERAQVPKRTKSNSHRVTVTCSESAAGKGGCPAPGRRGNYPGISCPGPWIVLGISAEAMQNSPGSPSARARDKLCSHPLVSLWSYQNSACGRSWGSRERSGAPAWK